MATYLAIADARSWIGRRDGFTAWTTTAVLTLALAVAIWAFLRTTDGSKLRLVVPATAVLLLGQNVRFGADLIGFALPTVSGVEVGSLVDLREVVSLSAERLGLGFVTGSLILTLIGIATVGTALWARRRAMERGLVTEVRAVPWLVLALGCAAAVPAVGLFGEGTGAWFVTGLVEFIAAGALVMAGLAAANHRGSMTGSRHRSLPGIATEGR